MSKKVVFIIAQNNFQDQELAEPRNVLINRGMVVKIASVTKDRAIGKFGSIVNPDLAISEIKVADFSAIIFIGGSGAADYFNDHQILNLVRDFKSTGKVIAAICIAPSILANAGVLIGKTVTAFSTEEDNLRNKGADYTGMSVEIDGNILTARDAGSAKKFGEKIAFILEKD